MFKKRVAEIRKSLYEYNANDATAFRYEEEEEISGVRKKVKYLQKHINNHHDMGKIKELPECYGYLAIGHLKLNDLPSAGAAMETQLELAVETKNEDMQRMALLNLALLSKFTQAASMQFKTLTTQTISFNNQIIFLYSTSHREETQRFNIGMVAYLHGVVIAAFGLVTQIVPHPISRSKAENPSFLGSDVNGDIIGLIKDLDTRVSKVELAIARSNRKCPEINIDYSGKVIKALDGVGSWFMCSRHCKNTENCKSWSWYSEKRHCALQSTNGSKTAERVGTLSGSLDCEETGHTLQEVAITGGKAGASSVDVNVETFKADNAFIDSSSKQWAGGRDENGKGGFVRMPHMIWYEFPQRFIPGQVSFGPSASDGGCIASNGFCGATKFQLIGTNDSVCNKFSRWTVLCEDLSGELFKNKRQNKYCKVDKGKREAFRCIGINVLEAGHDMFAEMSAIRIWKLV